MEKITRFMTALIASGHMLTIVGATIVALMFAMIVGHIIGFPLLTIAAGVLLVGESFFGFIFLGILVYFMIVSPTEKP